MSHYNYTQTLKPIYEKAARLYREGKREPSTYFNEEETTFLESINCRIQDPYDFAEDFHNYGEPDYETFQLIQAVCRDYFLTVLDGTTTGQTIGPADLPPKTDSIRGIAWLPRMAPKAKAKLRGELANEIMYGCGGDRSFFKEHDIHPAEFLNAVWRYEENDEALIDWVEARANKAKSK
ncbi:MAG: DUF5069 domain-containing protein [Opitutaceae bacterium]|nr:DUF5069 domain-containing protein [Opitutaceae bacterium]